MDFDTFFGKIVYHFKVEGWDTGSQCGQPMDDYSFETIYNRFSNRMLFNGLYLETYQDNNNKDVDFCFYGNFDFNGDSWSSLTDSQSPKPLLAMTAIMVPSAAAVSITLRTTRPTRRRSSQCNTWICQFPATRC